MAQSYAFSYRERQTKRKGIVYDVVFRIVDKDGVERQKSLCGYKTKTLAKAAYTEFMSTYIPTPKKYDGKTKVTYDYAIKQYLGAMQSQMKESSLYDISHTLNLHVKPYFTGKNLATITKADLYAWQDALWAKKKTDGKPYTVSRLMKIRNFFHTFIIWCSKRYNIKDFFEGVDAPIRREQKRDYVIWSKEEFLHFYENIDSLKYKALFYTLFFSGCRIGELLALTPKDFDGKALIIRSTYTRKTMDGSAYKITSTKNYKTHIVPLPQHAIEVLQQWLDHKKENNLPNAYIFGGHDPISQNSIQFALQKGIKRADLPKIRLHDFRHSYVSMLVSNGANFAVVAALIGDTLEQVVKTYAHLTNADLLNAVNML